MRIARHCEGVEALVGRVPVATIASCFALGAFTIAVISGIGSGRQSSEVLTIAIVSLVVCYVIGLCVGKAGEVAVREHVGAYEAEHEVPDTGEFDPVAVDAAAEGLVA